MKKHLLVALSLSVLSLTSAFADHQVKCLLIDTEYNSPEGTGFEFNQTLDPVTDNTAIVKGETVDHKYEFAAHVTNSNAPGKFIINIEAREKKSKNWFIAGEDGVRADEFYDGVNVMMRLDGKYTLPDRVVSVHCFIKTI